MVVGPQEVDQSVEAAGELVVVVRGVREKVGRLAVRPHDDAVLAVPERRGLEPERAVALFDHSALAKPGQRALHEAAAIQLALAKPAVHVRAESAEIRLLALQHAIDPPGAEVPALLPLGEIQPLAPLGFIECRRQLRDVLP